ncbi:hypothetical protein HCZ87_05530 [Phaeobacter sp. HF9A]|nr:hypothetical protein [Phaeobacter sp. HF9A]
MSWLGLWDCDGRYFDPAGLTPEGEHSCLLLREENALLARGSLVLEARLPDAGQPETLIRFDQSGDWPIRFVLTATPEGGIELELAQYGGDVQRLAVTLPAAGRADKLRLTLSWDAPAFQGRLAVERLDGDRACITEITAPRPWRLVDLQALLTQAPQSFIATSVEYLALSARCEPVGPAPGLALDTPMLTDQGPRPLSALRRGDLLRCASGALVPVLHVLRRELPARGSFAPVRLRAPYLGLTQDLILAPYQRIALTGSEVEYQFGREAVLAPTAMLTGSRVAERDHPGGPLIRYGQVILPGHEVPLAAGLGVASLFLGRLRRDRSALAASIAAGIDRNDLPEHAEPCYPVLRAHDAIVLAGQRLA